MTHRFLLALTGIALASTASAWEFRGETGVEGRYFTDGPGTAGYWHNGSVYAKAELFHEWNDRDDQFVFIPFARQDEHDENRTHADIRELSWIHVADGWESRVGISKVFWGVTEGRHLVDIINQTDLVEQIDQEEKLGQPMINVSTVRDWGILDVFILPGFRERTFPGEDGRPSLAVPVDTDDPIYESGAEQKRVDAAIRWQFWMGDWQFGLSHFSGTTREPLLALNTFQLSQAQLGAFAVTGQLPAGYKPRFIPVYEVIDQSGLEAQYVSGGWLWKLEVISRSGQGDRFTALDGGLEYTQVGIFESDLDLGWIVEYLWEDRDELLASPFEHDVLLGNRLTFNDIASTEVLWGVVWDPETEERAWSLETSRRIGDRFKVSLESRIYSNTGEPPTVEQIVGASLQEIPPETPLSIYGQEDNIQLEVVYYF
ncbi:MAG: hypothetical protein ACPG75_06640 [Alloalcanivorax venustensis]